MAEQIPYGVAVSLINKLASLAFREIGKIYGVMDELEKLKETVECIQAELSDAEEQQHQDGAVKIWIRRLREVVHDADNLFDDLLIYDLRRKVNGHSQVRDFFSSKNQLVFGRKMARKVEEIRQKFNDVSSDMSKLNLNRRMIISKENESSWRETSSFVLQSEIIGREESKKEIIDLLKQIHTNQNVSLIAIVGIGGLGKTTLAQLVYNDAEVQKLFQKKMWVCVSEDFEVKPVLKKMLKSLKNKEVRDLELDQLQKMFQEELNRQRYMLVLDDVWNESQLKWNALKTYLMCGGEGSKILVTTRSTMVSQTMGIKNPYVLKGLTKEQSWTLLKNLIFGHDTCRMSPSLESIGERIAKKCGGIPLAIKTIGGFLRTINEETNQWSSILNDDIWRLCVERQSIMPMLKLSYQNLPLGLRQCFAYCCLYPKDWEIQKDELIQLWMAQGYLESSIETQTMEEVGNQYVKILLMRSFFHDALISEYGDIKSFKMHDLMHDLAKLVVGNDCYQDSEGKKVIGRPMHVGLQSRTVCSLDSLDASHLRTIICCNMEARLITNPSFMKKLKYLRVLHLSCSSITQLPESIDKFKHLRYLDLSYCEELISLPKSISNLVSLQTLKLNRCWKLDFSVEIITKLINLRHLYIDGCKAFEEMMPAGLGKLTSLQRLSDFVVGDDAKSKSAKLNELKELNNITDGITISNLGLVKDVVLESQEANLRAKKYIRRLWLFWGEKVINENSDSLQLLDNLCPHQNLRELAVDGYPGARFSSWLPSLTNVVEIYLWGFSNCQFLPPLEKLPCLKKLEIREMKELKYVHYEEISDVFFPSLETLFLENCKNLKGWQRLGDDNKANEIDNHLLLPRFPRLSSLEIWECPNLTCMPTFSHLVEKLVLVNYRGKPMVETRLVQLESFFYPLSALKHLQIGKEIEIEAMAKKWMQNLTSLDYLSLWGSWLQHLQHLPSELQELDITFVHDDKLDLWKDEDEDSTQCHGSPLALRSLQKLSIRYCKNLKALPEQIGNLQSLKHIQIAFCPKLESLPEAMSCLTNLQTLYIDSCPLLRYRWQPETGEDWPKIAHIPNIIKY